MLIDQNVESGQAPPSVRGVSRLPNFIIIGAARSGTTSLFHHLRLHPQIYCSTVKEPRFFAYDEFYNQGLETYSELFKGAREDQICGEATTDYTRYPQAPGVPQRIAEVLPNVRLIYVVRHPVDRAYSHYVHRYTKELYPGKPILVGFDKHIEADPMCIDSSLYMVQIEQYLRFFPVSSLLVLNTDELTKPFLRETLRKACVFLGIDDRSHDMLSLPAKARNDTPSFLDATIKTQVGLHLRRIPFLGSMADALVPKVAREYFRWALLKTPYGRMLRRQFTPPPMSEKTRQRLITFFEPHNRRLEQFLGRNFPDWRA